MFDRHLGWIMPLWIIYIASGARMITLRLNSEKAWAALSTILVLSQLMCLVYFGMQFTRHSIMVNSDAEFALKVNRALDPGSTIGTIGGSGLAWYLDQHWVVNFPGIVTSDFVNPNSASCSVEVLRHHPGKRFDYWLIRAPDSEDGWKSWFMGDQVMAQVPVHLGRNSRVLHRADWSNLIGTADPVTSGVLDRVLGLEQVDRMDTGYLEDERRTR
jgi:hypothetical protein